MGGRRTGRSRQSLCGMNQAVEGVAGGLGAVLGCFGAGGRGPRVGEPGARRSLSSLTCSPSLSLTTGPQAPAPPSSPLIPLPISAFPSTTGKSKDKINKNG